MTKNETKGPHRRDQEGEIPQLSCEVDRESITGLSFSPVLVPETSLENLSTFRPKVWPQTMRHLGRS